MNFEVLDLRSISDEVRFRIFDYLRGKGVSSRDLGIHPSVANKIKNRKLKVLDKLPITTIIATAFSISMLIHLPFTSMKSLVTP